MIKVSIIIPVRNEALHIQKCLDSILASNFPKDQFEIIVVDGGSEDHTLSLLQQYDWRHISHKIICNRNKIVPVSLNLGIKQAAGMYIIRMDAHTEYAPDYIKECAKLLDAGTADNVGGPMRVIGRTSFEKAVALATSSRFGIGNAYFHFKNFRGYVDTVYLGAFKRECFETFGYFDEDLVRNQDDEFNFRLIKNGGTIYLSPDIRSWYRPRSSFPGLWKQYFEYGYWKVRVIQKHRMPASWRHVVPGLFVFSLFVSLLLSPWSPAAAFSLKVITAVYALACLAATGASSGKEKRIIPVLLLPVVFIILHFSYGTGFIKGIVVFFMFKKRIFHLC
jgi:glycosyltransferase involved in cell wall biosynthesis